MSSFLEELGSSFDTKETATINHGIDSEILEKNPLFTELLTEFIEFLHLPNNPLRTINNVNDNISISNSDEVSLSRLYEEYAPYFPQSIRADRKLFLKLMTDFYTIKGSRESIALFFRVVFDEDVNIIYPNEYVFTTSDNTWSPELNGGAGGFVNTRSFLSNNQVITDGYYYQPYSYVIETGVNIEQWKYPYTRCVHNAGYIFFGRVAMNIFVDMSNDRYSQPGLIEDENEPVFIETISDTMDMENRGLFGLSGSILRKVSHAYRPDHAVVDANGGIISIRNEVNSNQYLAQSIEGLRPRKNGRMINFSKSLSENKHLFISTNTITPSDVDNIVEIHAVVSYKDGLDNSFDNSDTLVSSGGTSNYPSISGVAGQPNVSSTNAFNTSGFIKKNNSSESVNVLPLRKDVISTVMGTYSSPIESTNSRRYFGISVGNDNRSWQGDVGYILMFSEALTDEEREVVTKFLREYTDFLNITISENVELDDVNLRGEAHLTQSDMYFRPGDISEYIGYNIDEILINWDNQPSVQIDVNPTTNTILQDLNDLI